MLEHAHVAAAAPGRGHAKRGLEKIAVSAVRVASFQAHCDPTPPRLNVDRPGRQVEPRSALPHKRTADRREERTVSAPTHPLSRPAVFDVGCERRCASGSNRPERQDGVSVFRSQNLGRSVFQRQASPPAQWRHVVQVHGPKKRARSHDRRMSMASSKAGAAASFVSRTKICCTDRASPTM